jgi:PKD repeat protein
LSVLGADEGGEANLTYTWATTGMPPAPVSFRVNGTNGAKNTTATFNKAGIYGFQVTIADAGGLSTTSTVHVTVAQTLTSIAVSPASATLNETATQQFTATVFDQFGNALSTQPSFTWTLAGVGRVNASGLYTAPGNMGFASILATCGAMSGSAAVTIMQILVPPLSSPAPVNPPTPSPAPVVPVQPPVPAPPTVGPTLPPGSSLIAVAPKPTAPPPPQPTAPPQRTPAAKRASNVSRPQSLVQESSVEIPLSGASDAAPRAHDSARLGKPPGANSPPRARVEQGDLGQESPLWNDLNTMDQRLMSQVGMQELAVGTAVTVSTGFTVGYVIWMLRGGTLVTSLLAQMPAWRLIDPLVVLSRAGDFENDDEQETLETIVDSLSDATAVSNEKFAASADATAVSNEEFAASADATAVSNEEFAASAEDRPAETAGAVESAAEEEMLV